MLRIVAALLSSWFWVSTVFGAPSIDENLIKAPVVTDMKISPDGEKIAFLAPVDGRNVVSIIRRQTLEPINVLSFESTRQIGEFYWANPDRLILRLDYFQSWYAAPISAGEWYAVNIDGKKRRNIFGFRSYTGSSSKIKTHEAGGARAAGQLVDLLRYDDDHILMSAIPFSKTGDRRSKLYRINIYNGRSKRVDYSPVENATYMTDHSGEPRLVVGQTKELKTEVFYRETADDEWKLFGQSDMEEGSLLPLAFKDNHSVYVSDGTKSDMAGVYLLNMKEGTSELIYSDPESEPTNFWYSEAQRNLFAVEYETVVPRYVFLGEESDSASNLKAMLAAFPGQQVRVVSQSQDERFSIIFTYSDKNPGDYYLFDVANRKLQFLAAVKPGVIPEQRLSVQPIELVSRDGVKLRGYLTLPRSESQSGPPPLIVNPHGGPHGVRDRWGFNYEAQLFADAGFAVLQINFRGSGGFGTEFLEAGFRNWGSDIQNDIIDATRWVAEQGLVDEGRICIYGASFGGYSALMAPIVAPDLFKCAIGFVGVYDLSLLYEKGDVSDRDSGVKYLEKVVGTDSKELADFSPAHRAGELNLPIYIIHGEEDPRAPVEHAELMMKALDDNKKTYRKLIFDKEGHGLYSFEAKQAMYQSILEFLNEHLPPAV